MPMNMGLFVLTKPSTCMNLHSISANSNKQSFLGSRSRFHFNLDSSNKVKGRRRTSSTNDSIQPVPPPIPSSLSPASIPGRKGWIVGAFLALLLPFLKKKWGPLFLLKKEVDEKLQTIEDVAEGLERLADGVEHMAENVAQKLPEGSLRRAANLIEDAAEKVELAAHLTDTAIDKIQDIEAEVESGLGSNQTKTSELVDEKTNDQPS